MVYSAICAVFALHSKGYAWLDVKPSNFVFNLASQTYVAIDLEGAAPLHAHVAASAAVSKA